MTPIRHVPSRLQRAASNGTYTRFQQAYRAYLDHTMACDTCGPGETSCDTGRQLWRTYQAVGTEAR